MRIDLVLEKLGIDRVKVVRETGVSEELVDGEWKRKMDILGYYVPLKFKAHKETGQIYQLYRYGKDLFGIILPRKAGYQTVRAWPCLRMEIGADDCRVYSCRIKDFTPELAKAIRIKRKRFMGEEQREKMVKVLASARQKAKTALPQAAPQLPFERTEV